MENGLESSFQFDRHFDDAKEKIELLTSHGGGSGPRRTASCARSLQGTCRLPWLLII
jgi:hypothetical protein